MTFALTFASACPSFAAEIDQVGVQPDRACAPLGGGEGAKLSSSGIPVGPGASELVIEELATDGEGEREEEHAAGQGY
jgi:hypothetical protein